MFARHNVPCQLEAPGRQASVTHNVAGFQSPLSAKPVRLRSGRLTDIAELQEIESRTFSYCRLSRASFRRFLSSPCASLIVAECGDTIAGYALVLFHSHGRIARLYSIAVDPMSGRHGIGSALLTAAVRASERREFKTLRLEVREDNAPALNLYRKAGYLEKARLPCYYGDGQDGIRLEKDCLEFPR